MKFVSTRGAAGPVGLSEAIRAGAAPDGGLYLPASLPRLPALDPDLPLHAFAVQMLTPFFAGDALAESLAGICAQAFDFPLPIVTPDPSRPQRHALELFHGPTGAFKDFGARFLMACFDRIGDRAGPLTVLAATSGDTGGAVGAAAEGRDGVRALILYPKGRVSPFQELQLTCWNAPVEALEVEGDFDACQRLVKEAFADPGLVAAHHLTSANSINIGRLLPQMAYLGWAAAQMEARTGRRPGLIVPTGNLGHGFAAVYARAIGLPIGPIILVTNANRSLQDWRSNGTYEPRASIATIANAMDVGAPSNFERLIALPAAQRALRVELVDDDAIRARIRREHVESGYLWCPHSATAAEAYARLPSEEQGERPWLAAATAHPYKFAEVIEPLIDGNVTPPPALAAILDREAAKRCIAPDLGALADALAATGVAA